jgi:hypothetical protein
MRDVMRAVSVVRRSGRLAWALLLVALVATVGLTVSSPAYAAAQTGAGVALAGSPQDAIAPSRIAVGQLAEPAPERTRALGDGTGGGLLAIAPSGVPRVARLETGGAVGSAAPGGALVGVAGVRGPPASAVLQA